MSRPGDRRDPLDRLEHGVVDAHRDDAHPLGPDPQLGRDVPAGGLRDRHDRRQPPRHPAPASGGTRTTAWS